MRISWVGGERNYPEIGVEQAICPECGWVFSKALDIFDIGKEGRLMFYCDKCDELLGCDVEIECGEVEKVE